MHTNVAKLKHSKAGQVLTAHAPWLDYMDTTNRHSSSRSISDSSFEYRCTMCIEAAKRCARVLLW